MVKRPPFVPWACLWGLGAAIPIVCIAVDILYPGTHVLGRDFAGFWGAGRVASSGNLAAAYDPAAVTELLRSVFHVTIIQPLVYPPWSLVVLIPFGLLPYPLALAAWTAAGAAFFLYAAKPYTPFSPLLAVLTPAALMNIWDGQIGLLVGALWLLAFRLARRRPFLAGAIAGAATLKPHLGLLLIARFLAAPRVALGAAAFIVVMSIATLSLWPLMIEALRRHAAFLAVAEGSFFFRLMPSAYAAYGQSWVMHIPFAAAAGALLARYRRAGCFELATAAFLILPYAHNYDMTVASLGFAILLYAQWGELSVIQRALCALAFFVPVLTLVAGWAVPPILLAGLFIQLSRPDVAPPAR